jgi:radical SAM superfamily enzyme YgiQ (UPF0313 family)
VTKIALVQTYHPYTQMTHLHPLGLMYVATGARARGYTDLHILDMKVDDLRVPQAAARLAELRPDVVGMTAMTYEAGCLHALAAELKRLLPAVKIVAGGPHPSVAADDVMKDVNIDFCVRGEGETTFPALLDALRAGADDFSEVLGVVWRRSANSSSPGEIVYNPDRTPPDTLDELGFPAWDLIDIHKYHSVPRGGIIYAHKEFATIFSSRACPWRCTYCHNSYGKKFRERSARHVLEEIDLLVKQYGVRELVFYDDIFNFKPDRAKAICRGLVDRQYNLKLTFPNGLRGDILDEELVDLMKDAGMYRAMIAIESGVPRVQKVMKKNLRLPQTKKIVDYMSSRGVMTHGAFMLGFPTETREEMEETIRWAKDSSFHTAAFYRVIPFKGTELFRQVEEAGHTLPTDWSHYEPYYSDINVSAVPEDEIAKIRRRAYFEFYLSPRRLWNIFRLIPNKARMLPYLTLLFARRAYAR